MGIWDTYPRRCCDIFRTVHFFPNVDILCSRSFFSVNDGTSSDCVSFRVWKNNEAVRGCMIWVLGCMVNREESCKDGCRKVNARLKLCFLLISCGVGFQASIYYEGFTLINGGSTARAP